MFLDAFKDAGSLTSLTIYRAKASKPICGIVSGPIIMVPLHYFKGKSLPCTYSDATPCPFCKKGFPKRMYGYQAIRSMKGTAALIELTATATNQFLTLMESLPEKHLALLKVSRGCSRPNAPLELEVDYRPCSDAEFIEWQRKVIDVDLMKRSLIKLWDMPPWPESMNETDYDDLCARFLTEIYADAMLGY